MDEMCGCDSGVDVGGPLRWLLEDLLMDGSELQHDFNISSEQESSDWANLRGKRSHVCLVPPHLWRSKS